MRSNCVKVRMIKTCLALTIDTWIKSIYLGVSFFWTVAETWMIKCWEKPAPLRPPRYYFIITKDCWKRGNVCIFQEWAKDTPISNYFSKFFFSAICLNSKKALFHFSKMKISCLEWWRPGSSAKHYSVIIKDCISNPIFHEIYGQSNIFIYTRDDKCITKSD